MGIEPWGEVMHPSTLTSDPFLSDIDVNMILLLVQDNQHYKFGANDLDFPHTWLNFPNQVHDCSTFTQHSLENYFLKISILQYLCKGLENMLYVYIVKIYIWIIGM